MNAEVLYWSILTISVLGFAVEQWLEYLNLTHQRKDIPSEVAAFYDASKYTRSLDYHRAQTQFAFLSGAFSFLASIGFLAFGGYGWLDGLLRPYFGSELILALLFFGTLLLASDVVTLPFQLYTTFRIEARFGFNTTTVTTFFLDKLKGYALGGLLGGALLALLFYLVERLGAGFWIWFGLIASAFLLFMNLYYTSLILPLFNRLTPLPDGELKTAIRNFAATVQFPLDTIFVMDGSKRSKKANAFFSGMGKKKKIVLYDTLIQNHTTEELIAVLAHEVGHFKKKHIVWSYVLSMVQLFLVLFVLSLTISNKDLSLALGGSRYAIHLNLVAFGILFTPVSAITGLFMSMLSRRNEYEADAFARTTYNGEALASALKKLSVDSLSNLYPHPAYVFFHYSHPTLLQRLKALRA